MGLFAQTGFTSVCGAGGVLRKSRFVRHLRARGMPSSLPYELEIDRRRALVSLLSQLNEIPWAEIERVGGDIVARLQELDQPALLVDLTGLDYMGSAQVALVVRLFKTVKERQGRMVVAVGHPMVLEVLTLAGLNKIWTIVDTRQEGMQLLGFGASDEASPGGGWLIAGGILCLAVSAVGMSVLLTKANWLPLQQALYLELAAAALAFPAGLLVVLKCRGARRTLGTGVLIGSVALLLASVFQLGAQLPLAGGRTVPRGAPAPAPTAPAKAASPNQPAPAVAPNAGDTPASAPPAEPAAK